MIGYSFGVHNGKEQYRGSSYEDMLVINSENFSPTTKFNKAWRKDAERNRKIQEIIMEVKVKLRYLRLPKESLTRCGSDERLRLS